MYWPKLSTQQIKQRIFDALGKNLNYRSEKILGIPATFLDTDIFYEDAPFLKDAPFLSLLIANPNHIGCHTLEGEKEAIFKGTQEIERDLIRICAEEIFAAEKGSCDGYVASGGTEANIEALWIYRNYFMRERKATPEEIVLLYSEDSHYSFPKAANLLCLKQSVISVDPKTRSILPRDLTEKIEESLSRGAKYFIVNINLSTTMFGSVDDIDQVAGALQTFPVEFKIHVDAAFGGFIYPFTKTNSRHNFSNPHVSSITIDGHKMLQSPYGTGIFLVRKHMMQYVCTEEASYVQGKDYTLCGSRSGANAACVWMILHMHGSLGWQVKMEQLLDRTSTMCASLAELGVEFYRHPRLNIITIKSEYISASLAKTFTLVPDNHDHPRWYKIVMMPHVRQGVSDSFINQLANELTRKTSRWTS
jgi:tyrosine decarboxylase / aspartate 1-decarboxylase